MIKVFLCWFLYNSLPDIVACLPATLFGGAPFSVVWNAASEKCQQHFGIEFNFTAYNIEDNSGDAFHGDKMMIFYSDELGMYPWVSQDGTRLYGGIPQLAPLEEHLNATSRDIKDMISNDTFDGLAVIDWEKWRPLYVHNFDSKKVYQNLSKELVRQGNPSWSNRRITKKAKQDFNKAARRFMLSTLQTASTLRPKGRWGFYGFPRCYRHHCIKVRRDNNRLRWMFSASTGLYPSLYLKKHNDSWMRKARFVHDTLRETFRVFSKFSSANKTVIVPYTRFRYTNPKHFYDESELLITMAMSAIKGSAGVILWDSARNFEQENLCRDMERYLTGTLGPFVVTLTNFLQNCSLERCSGHGRCVVERIAFWQASVSTYMLHLAGKLSKMFRQYSWLKPWHNLTYSDFSVLDILKNYDYCCQCYPDWSGRTCNVSSEA